MCKIKWFFRDNQNFVYQKQNCSRFLTLFWDLSPTTILQSQWKPLCNSLLPRSITSPKRRSMVLRCQQSCHWDDRLHHGQLHHACPSHRAGRYGSWSCRRYHLHSAARRTNLMQLGLNIVKMSSGKTRFILHADDSNGSKRTDKKCCAGSSWLSPRMRCVLHCHSGWWPTSCASVRSGGGA